MGDTWEMSLEREVEAGLQCVLTIQLRQGQVQVFIFFEAYMIWESKHKNRKLRKQNFRGSSQGLYK